MPDCLTFELERCIAYVMRQQKKVHAMKKITLTYPHKPSMTTEKPNYKVQETVNSVELKPGDTIGQSRAESLCNDPTWEVTIIEYCGGC